MPPIELIITLNILFKDYPTRMGVFIVLKRSEKSMGIKCALMLSSFLENLEAGLRKAHT